MDMKSYVSNEELLALTKQAFDNDEVAEFLCGENGYAIHGNRDIPTDIPTYRQRYKTFPHQPIYI